MLSCREASNATLPARLPIGDPVGPRLNCVKVKTPSVIGIAPALLDSISVIEPIMLGPNINGDLHIGNSSDATPTNLSFGNGALGVIPKNNKWTYQSSTAATYPSVDFDFNASRSNAIYTDNGSIYPLSLALNYIIKC